jgi:hypothetical protein
LTPTVVGTPICSRINLSAAADPEWFQRPPETVRRLRGELSVSTEGQAGLTRVEIAVGFAVLPAEAVDNGQTPCPLEDAYWDGWMWHHFYPIVIDDSQPLFLISHPPSGMIDGRGQRKLEDGVLFMAAESILAAGVPPQVTRIEFGIRWLLSPTSRG